MIDLDNMSPDELRQFVAYMKTEFRAMVEAMPAEIIERLGCSDEQVNHALRVSLTAKCDQVAAMLDALKSPDEE